MSPAPSPSLPSPHTWLVILAGGIGSRFWPLSRAARPKQMLDLFGDGPMLRVTLERALPLSAPERTLIVTSDALADGIAALLPELPRAHILAEPSGRNTAPAIAWAAHIARRADPAAVLAVLPADHYIPDPAAFRASAAHAIAIADAAEDPRLVTLGVTPTRPDTGYGYIQRGAARADGAFDVARFVEKPDLARAMAYLADGGYAWNAGMFFMRASLFLDELARRAPGVAAPLAHLDATSADLPAFIAATRAAWHTLEAISVDYAVMERSDRVAVLPAAFPWSDVGAWPALMDHRAAGASSFERGDVLAIDASDNVIVADGGGLVAAVGVSGLTIVHTPDATLVVPTAEAQRVREVVAALDGRGRGDLL
jgi:mannose-1-phosphate guanylyltransferase